MEQDEKRYEVSILWGDEPEFREQGVFSYDFASEAELSAFMQGVEAGVGWMDYEVVEPGVREREL